MDFFKDKIVFPEMLKLLLLSFAWLGNSGMCVLVGGGRAVNRKHHPAERCDLRFGSKRTENFSKRTEKFEITRGAASPQGDVCTKMTNHIEFLSARVISPLLYQPVLGLVDEFA